MPRVARYHVNSVRISSFLGGRAVHQPIFHAHRIRRHSGTATADAFEPFYHYQSGRWLYNEQAQLAKRYVKFSVPALERAAAEGVGSGCCSVTGKVAEGFYNKTFSLTMDDGREVIAKIPNPNAGPRNITIANEAATMEFLRTVLDIPVPKVYAWSVPSLASNPVGAEYIIMEKAKGRQLSELWADMSNAHKAGLIENLVSIEAKMAKARLKQYGSLYFMDAKTVPNCNDNAHGVSIDYSEREHSNFIIGTSAEISFWQDGRDALDISRGPWTTMEGYFASIARREIAYLRTRGTKADSTTAIAKPLQHDPDLHIRLLEQFLAILPFILPKDQFIGYPTLWHTDLHADNIFVEESDPSKITSIIDWQSVGANPFFMQARFPSIIECDWPYPWGTVKPRLPEDYDDLDEHSKRQAMQEFQDVRLKKFYEIASRKFNPLLFRALDATREQGEKDIQISTLLAIVGRSWLDGPIPLREILIQIFENWERFSTEKVCPISYSQEEVARSREEAEAWASVYEEFNTLRTQIVGDKEGWVSHEEYDEAKERYEENKGLIDGLRRKLELAGGGEG